jgi:hypothetical protein
MGSPLVLKHIPSARQIVRAEAGLAANSAMPHAVAAVRSRLREKVMVNLLCVPPSSGIG